MTDKWQPIETAPEDVDILVLRRDGVMHVAKVAGYYIKYGILSCDFGNATTSIFFPLNDDPESCDAPTHWMPLPAPPKEASQDFKDKGSR